MIKINLLGEPARIDESTKRALIIYVASLVGIVLCGFVARSLTTERIAHLERETAALNLEFLALKKQTKEVRDLESKRRELRAKLDVIARLQGTKVGPVRIMDDLNVAVPDRIWLTEIGEQSGVLRLSGYALDNQTIATFMKDLDRSDFFDTVELVETKQMEREGIKIKLFTLESKVNYAGASGESTQRVEGVAVEGVG